MTAGEVATARDRGMLAPMAPPRPAPSSHPVSRASALPRLRTRPRPRARPGPRFGVATGGVPGVRALVRRGLGRVFGPPPFDPDRDLGDPGLFGPTSASWQVIGDPAAIVGGVGALLTQLLHPLAMAGVAEHSRFRNDPLGRLRATSAYVTTTAFGSTDEALTAAATVRGRHRRVRGHAPDGRAYAADDPHLLAWVSIALTHGFLHADTAYAAHPAAGQPPRADAFVAEQSRAAALLDPRVDLDAIARDETAREALRRGALDGELPLLADGLLPQTAAGLEAAIDAFAPELAVDAAGEATVRFLLWPPLEPAVRAGYLPVVAGAVATLRPDHRRLLGLPAAAWAHLPARAHTRALLGALRLATGRSPSVAAAARRAGHAPAA